METKRIIGVLLAVVLAANVAQAVITTSQTWEGVVNITNGDTFNYYENNSFTWTLNEKDGVPANVFYSGGTLNQGHCILGVSTSSAVTTTLTIQTTVGAPGVIDYAGNISRDPDLCMKVGHVDDVGILNIENGNTLLINGLYKYHTSTGSPVVPASNAVLNINDGHVFCYISHASERAMTGMMVNIAEGSSLRLLADIANVYDQATYAAYTKDSVDLVTGSVNAQPGTMLVFSDGGIYNSSPTVLISAVVPEPATMLLLGLGGFGLFWRKVR